MQSQRARSPLRLHLKTRCPADAAPVGRIHRDVTSGCGAQRAGQRRSAAPVPRGRFWPRERSPSPVPACLLPPEGALRRGGPPTRAGYADWLRLSTHPRAGRAKPVRAHHSPRLREQKSGTLRRSKDAQANRLPWRLTAPRQTRQPLFRCCHTRPRASPREPRPLTFQIGYVAPGVASPRTSQSRHCSRFPAWKCARPHDMTAMVCERGRMAQIHDGRDLGFADLTERVERTDSHVQRDLRAWPPLDE